MEAKGVHPTFVTLTLHPSPKAGETLNLAPLLLFWEKGLGDEGNSAKLGCAQLKHEGYATKNLRLIFSEIPHNDGEPFIAQTK